MAYFISRKAFYYSAIDRDEAKGTLLLLADTIKLPERQITGSSEQWKR